MSAVSQAKHQQNLSANNVIVPPLNAPEGKNEDVLEGPIGEVLAQSGSVAILPCKITDPGAGTVSVVRFMRLHIYILRSTQMRQPLVRARARAHQSSLPIRSIVSLVCLFVSGK